MTTETTTSTKANQPFEKRHFGIVEAAIWQNVGDGGRPYYNATFGRRYKDKNGNWQVTNTYGKDASLVLSKASEWAFTRIMDLEDQDYQKRRDAEQYSTA